jgi:cyclopropane fatty-acyl-phospholipid synthase-like methyltransferase
MTLRRRLFFWYRYLTGQTPWDTQITPPELRALIADEQLPPGQALELGCGTGTNAIFMARHGWQVTAIDYIAQPIALAKRKARQQGVDDSVRFLVGDVTHLDAMKLTPPYDLAVDIGCMHGLATTGQQAYAQQLPALLRPGALYLLYAFCARPDAPGIDTDDLLRLMEPAFELLHVEYGDDTAGSAPSAWYRFVRRA